jgi:hypothetical protein
MSRLRRSRLGAFVVVVALGALLAGCLPPPPPPSATPNSVMGQSRLTAAQIVAYYQAKAPKSLPYRATGATLEQLATMFVDEGNRYDVRGDIAFAQSIIETGWFNYPDYGIVRPDNDNFAGIGACSSCGNGYQFSSALSGVRAQLQLLRNYADPTSTTLTIPDPPVPELWGLNPTTAASNFDHYFHKGRAPKWTDMGNGNWASAPDYGTLVLQVYNEMLKANGLPPEGS